MIKMTIKPPISQVIIRMNGRARRIGELKGMLREKKNDYWIQALTILITEVYGKYDPQYYTRTYNLLRSLDAETFDELTSVGLRIFLNPNKANIRSVTSKAQFKYYPAFVLRGIFFKYPGKMAERPFLQQWHSVLGKRFLKDVRQHIHKGMRIA